MTPRFARFLLVAAATALLSSTLPTGAAQGAGSPVPATAPAWADAEPGGARVIVKYKSQSRLMRAAAAPGKGPQHAATLAGRHGLALRDGRVVDRRSQVVRGAPGMRSADLAARLAADPEVEYAVPDRRVRALAVPNDPLYAASGSISPAAGQWYLRAPDATFVSAIDAAGAWDLGTGSAAVVVADIDTGVRFEHPDLAGKLLPGYDMISDLGDAADGDGPDADASDPGDWTVAGQCGLGEPATLSSWHGTQTAGLIGALTDNALGMASVGRNVMVLPVRALGKCGGTDSDIITAMLWAGGLPVADPGIPANTHPARVINLSLGGVGSCSLAYQDAVAQLAAAGVVVVASAGNDEGQAVSTPANCPGVIAVGGLRHAGSKVGFSNVGSAVAISAPGGNCINTGVHAPCLYPILSTTNSGTQGPVSSSYTDSIDYAVGTSFSAPLVSGTAALMLSAHGTLAVADVRALLQRSSRPFPTTSSDPAVPRCHAPDGFVQDECLCTSTTCGAGMLDAAAAVAAAQAHARLAVRLASSASEVLVNTSVDLDGSASTALPGRTIASYRWEITGGAASASFAGAVDGPTARLDARRRGQVTVRLTVTDSSGASNSLSTRVDVNPLPAPRVRIVPAATQVVAGGTLGFDGSGSTVSSGLTVAGYQWSIVAGGGIATVQGASNAPTFTLATSAPGSVTVQLTVTDSAGEQSATSTSVTVTAAPGAGGAPASGGSGGGALQPGGWLPGLLLAALALAWMRRRASAALRG